MALDYSTLIAQPCLHLDCLCLDGHTRSMGVVLFSLVKSHGRELGCTNLQWQSPERNAPGIRFYERTDASRLEKQRYTLALS